MRATIMLKILIVSVILLFVTPPNRRLIKNGNVVIPIIALRDTYRVMMNVITNIEKHISTA